jgi:hypothetical protein
MGEKSPAPVTRPTVEIDIHRIARLMDEAIRIGPIGIGLDGIIGLVPGIGDLIGALISFYIVYRASAEGAPRSLIAIMMSNIAIDTTVGVIPVVGDAFDFMWKSNMKNVRLYDEWLDGRHRPGRAWLQVVIAVLSVFAAIAIPIILIVLLLRTVLR